jgi:general secretion pathway protein G
MFRKILNAHWLAMVLAVAVLATGCGGKEPPADKDKEKPAPSSTAPAPTKTEGAVTPTTTKTAAAAAVPAAEQKALAEVVGMIPADAIVYGTLRTPRVMVDQLNRFAGPELATLPGMLLSALPAEIIDMDAPMAWAVMDPQEGPGVVLLVKQKQGETLKGLDAPNAIVQLPRGGVPLSCMKAGAWLVFGDEKTLQLFKSKSTGPKIAVDAAIQARLAEDLAWMHLAAKPLTTQLKPMIEQWKTEAQQKATAAKPSNEAQLADWCQNVVDQLQSLDVDLVVNEKSLVMRCDLGLTPDGSLMKLAQTMKPVDVYQGMLPETDRFLAAGWTHFDTVKGVPQFKAFLKPAMDLALEKLGEMSATVAQPPPAVPTPEGGRATSAKADAPPNPMKVLRTALEEFWKMADEYPEALTGQNAALFELPTPGEGVYRTISVEGLKDGAKYQVLLKKGTSAVDDLIQGLLGTMPKGPDAPKMDVGVTYKTAAETIEGVPVDVMLVKINLEPSANMPPEMRQQFDMTSRMMKTYYGKDGLEVRIAVVGNQALSTMGPPEVMARAIKRARGQVGDLAKQKAVAEAIGRVPQGSCAAFLVSCPGYIYSYDKNMDAMLMMLPPERQKTLAAIPLPQIDPPAMGDLSVVSVQVRERGVRLQVDVPQSEINRSVPYVRTLAAHLYFDFLNIFMHEMPGLWSSPMGGPSMMVEPGMNEPWMDRPGVEPGMEPVSREAISAMITIESLERALDVFELNCGRFPTQQEGLGALLVKPADVKDWHGPYLTGLPKDPWGRPYMYRYPGLHNGGHYDLFSCGPDGKEGGGDDVDNWSGR